MSKTILHGARILHRTRTIQWALGFAALLALASCRPYLDRVDTINLAGGEAVAANKAIHTIDPWPPEAFKKHQNSSAKRLAVGAKHYDEGPPKKGKNLVTRTK